MKKKKTRIKIFYKLHMQNECAEIHSNEVWKYKKRESGSLLTCGCCSAFGTTSGSEYSDWENSVSIPSQNAAKCTRKNRVEKPRESGFRKVKMKILAIFHELNAELMFFYTDNSPANFNGEKRNADLS